MLWKIKGAHRDTGDDETVLIEADSENEARNLASRKHNLLVASIRKDTPTAARAATITPRVDYQPASVDSTANAQSNAFTRMVDAPLPKIAWFAVRVVMLLVGLLSLASGVFDGWQVALLSMQPAPTQANAFAGAAGAIVSRTLWNASLQSASWGILLIALSMYFDGGTATAKTQTP